MVIPTVKIPHAKFDFKPKYFIREIDLKSPASVKILYKEFDFQILTKPWIGGKALPPP